MEEKILEHPAVAEIAIVGVPDRDWGEVGAAVIVLSDPSKDMADLLDDWIETHIAKYKRPRHLVFWDAIPKSGYGKIEKKTVRAMLQEGPLSDLFDGNG